MNAMQTEAGEYRQLGLVAWGGRTVRRLAWWRARREAFGDVISAIVRRQVRQARRRHVAGRVLAWVKSGWRP